MTEWRPSCGVDTARRRARMLARAREFFAARDVLEVETPVLSPAAVSDPHVESIEARLALCPGQAAYLRTSPEFAMKRLLSAGYPDIYEIGRVYRDGEAGARHQPEFTLVEWYRRGFGLDEIVMDTLDFLTSLIDRRRLARPAEQLDYGGAFQRFVGLDPFESPIAALAAAAGADEGLLAALGERREDWLDLLLATRIAPRLETDRLTVIRHYPRSQAALARLCPADPRVADRFEVFRGELELANGFVELRDAAEQARRIEQDQARRRQANQRVRPRDECFLAALEHGLPACAGVAVGFDRLVMINEMAEDIRQVQTFAFEDAVTEDRATDYALLRKQLRALISDEPDPLANTANFVGLLHGALPDINWLGVYVLRGEELVLGPFQGKPACVRLPLGSGVCGTAAARRETLRVADVDEFSGHIACDPASRSELVVPLVVDDRVLGVLDIDSPRHGRFSEHDQRSIETLCADFVDDLAAKIGGGFI